MRKTVWIVDYGSQYCFLIGRCIRSSLGVWCEIISPQQLDTVTRENTAAVVLSGGPKSVYEQKVEDDQHAKRIINDSQIPVIGVCYGMQLCATMLDGIVIHGEKGEYGHTQIELLDKDGMFANTNPDSVWMSHQDVVINPGIGSKIVATSGAGIAAFENNEKKCWAVQFHPEVSHTKCGIQLLSNFLTKVCGIQLGSWNSSTRLEQCRQYVSHIITPNDFVILGLSGGVDSMVCAALLTKLLVPTMWQAVLVDLGIMRQSEVDDVRKCCDELLIPLTIVDRSDECFAKLSGITEPEQKRKIIGALFIDAFKSVTSKLKPTVLCQGTIYPDVIESGKSQSGSADIIKSHHNVGGLPKDLGLKLLEPLRWFFKDEVRSLGLDIGLPKNVINRHPFPGPGLAIRIVGEVTPDKVKIVAKADFIFLEHIRQSGFYDAISQAFAGMFDCKAVGVVGDQRRYGWVIVLRAVCTDDFMTANVYPFHVNWLEATATDIINRCPEVARVVFDVTSKPPGTIELE